MTKDRILKNTNRENKVNKLFLEKEKHFMTKCAGSEPCIYKKAARKEIKGTLSRA